MAIKPIQVDFSDVAWGVNFTDDMNQLRKREVQDCENVTLTKNGVKRRPGSIAGEVSFSNNARGIHVYRQLDGTETLLVVSDGKLYSVPKNNLDSKTELFDMGGVGDAYFDDYLDKCWITNGSSMVKVENNVAYQIGISPPSGVSAAVSAGGTIPDGDYTVYACYARQVDGANKLFSVGENLGTVTMGSGNNTIAITNFLNSSDAQVNNKCIFLTIPAGTTPFYYETDDNTTTSFNITTAAQRDDTTIYGSVAEENTIPSTFEYIYAFNKSIYGSVSNVLYKSLKNTNNVYDLERFTSNIVLPYEIVGIFSLGEHLYLNTRGGIIVIQYGDINSEWDRLTSDYFYDIKTVQEVPNKWVIGLTYQTMRVFDGEKFLGQDIGRNIRTKLKRIYGNNLGFKPFAILRRSAQDNRLEYHLCYNDTTISSTSNNQRLVLNIDKIQFLPENEVIAPWELWSNSANYMAKDLNEVVYNLQDASTPKLYRFDLNKTIDDGIYQKDGTLGTSTSYVYAKFISRAFFPSPIVHVDWQIFHIVAKMNKQATIKVYIRETVVQGYESETEETGLSLWGSMVWGVDKWASKAFLNQHIKIDEDAKGSIMYVQVEQTSNDKDFHILNLIGEGMQDTDYYTIGGQ